MSRRLALLSSLLFLGAVACLRKPTEAPRERLEYPPARRTDHVDDYHGTKVRDPYRWLEDDNSEETKAWVTAQNKLTFDYLGKIKARPKIRKRIEELYNYAKQGPPTRVPPDRSVPLPWVRRCPSG